MKKIAFFLSETSHLRLKFELFTYFNLQYIITDDPALYGVTERIYYGKITYISADEVYGNLWKIYVTDNGTCSLPQFGDAEIVRIPLTDGYALLNIFDAVMKIPLYSAALTEYSALSEYRKGAYSITGRDVTRRYLRLCEADFRLYVSDGTVMTADYDNDVCSAKDGVRVTRNKAEIAYAHSVHAVGECETLGFGNEDEFTWCSRLQKYINDGLPAEQTHAPNHTPPQAPLRGQYSVFNHATHHTRELFHPICANILRNANLQQGDIVILTEDTHLPLAANHKKYCESKGARFLFVIFPEYHNKHLTAAEKHILTQTMQDPSFSRNFASSRYLGNICAAYGIPYIDLNPPLTEVSEDVQFYIDRLHLGSNGQDWIARQIYTALCGIAAADNVDVAVTDTDEKYAEFLRDNACKKE